MAAIAEQAAPSFCIVTTVVAPEAEAIEARIHSPRINVAPKPGDIPPSQCMSSSIGREIKISGCLIVRNKCSLLFDGQI